MPRKPKPKPVAIDREDLERRLQTEFCPPLDSALLTALLLDFPSPTTADESVLRRTLLTLSSASEEPSSSSASTSNSTSNFPSSSTSTLESSFEVWSLDETEERDAGGGEGHDDPVEFIRAVFPKRERWDVLERLRDAGEDVERVLEELLSEDFIADEGAAMDLGTASSSSSSLASSVVSGPTKAEKRRQKALQKAATTLSLTSTALVPRPPPPASTSSSSTIPTGSALAQAAPTSNTWVSYSSLADHLSLLLHASPLAISSFFHSSSLDPSTSSALVALVDKIASDRPATLSADQSAFWEALGLAYEQRWERERAAIALRACQGRAGDAMDLLELIQLDGERAGSRVAPIVLAPPSAPVPAPTPSSPSQSITRKAPTRALPPPDERNDAAEWATPAECGEYAAEYLAKRNEAFRSAARHFQKGSRGDRGAAWYWAEEGRDMDRRAKVWEGRAMRALVGSRRVDDPNTVDLHGVTLHHALSMARESCNTWWSSPTQVNPGPPLRIITGIGLHSKNNTPILLPAVVKMLDHDGWIWRYDDRGVHRANGVHGAVLVTGVVRRPR